MFKRFKFFTIFYLIIVVLNIVVLYYIKDYRMVVKPMIMGSLIGFYTGNVVKQSPVFLLGMVFALIGDIFLLFDNELFFIIGLGGFLLMQVFYTAEFFKDRADSIKQAVLPIVIVYIVGLIFLILMWSGLGDLKWPVMMYAIAITTMVSSAFLRNKDVIWYNAVIWGVLLFLLSDAWLGMAKFGVVNSGLDSVIVMLSYMAAQYLIVRGITEREVPVPMEVK